MLEFLLSQSWIEKEIESVVIIKNIHFQIGGTYKQMVDCSRIYWKGGPQDTPLWYTAVNR